MSSASAESDHAAQKGDNVETQDFASSGGNYHIRAKRRRKILRLYMEGGSTPRHAGSGHAKARPYIANFSLLTPNSSLLTKKSGGPAGGSPDF